MSQVDTSKSIVVKYVKTSNSVLDLKLGSAGSAGLDIHANESGVIPCGSTKLVSTGLRFEIPEGTFMSIVPRSSLGLKTFATIPNSPGILDSDYRGELGLIIRQGYPLEFFAALLPVMGLVSVVSLMILAVVHWSSLNSFIQLALEVFIILGYSVGVSFLVPYYANDYGFKFEKGDRLAQVILQNHLSPTFELVEDLSSTDRGHGGFGSTGIKP